MSSYLKNLIPKRKFRERAQPIARSKYGLLEKKRDYKERAKNYHKKEDFLSKIIRKTWIKGSLEK